MARHTRIHMFFAHAFEVDPKAVANFMVDTNIDDERERRAHPDVHFVYHQLGTTATRERLNEALSRIAGQPIVTIKVDSSVPARADPLDEPDFRLFICNNVVPLVGAVQLASLPALSEKDQMSSLKALFGCIGTPTLQYTFQDRSKEFWCLLTPVRSLLPVDPCSEADLHVSHSK